MSGLSAEFRQTYADQVREGYSAFETALDCPYLKGTDERKAWRYGWDWANSRSVAADERESAISGRPMGAIPLIGTSSRGGDYDVRSQDVETKLIGPMSDTIIDAARLANTEHRNGFPNFAMYRLVLAGDRQYLPLVRQWWVLFAIEWCGQRMRDAYSTELATIAAWDSLQRVMEPTRPILSAHDVAKDLGVDEEAYRRVRDGLRSILSAALRAYWEWLEIGYRVVRTLEKKVF